MEKKVRKRRIISFSRPLTERIICAANRLLRAKQENIQLCKKIIHESKKTYQDFGPAPVTGMSVQVMPTSPEIEDAEIPKGVRRGLTEAAVGD